MKIQIRDGYGGDLRRACWPDHRAVLTSSIGLMLAAGAVWEPGQRLGLLQLHRLSPVLRALRRRTDLLFRHAGMDLDEQ